MTCQRRPIVLVEITAAAIDDPVEQLSGTWMLRGALPAFDPGPIDWPDDKPVHVGKTPGGRSYRASSPFVREWTPDSTFVASLDRTLDDYFRNEVA